MKMETKIGLQIMRNPIMIIIIQSKLNRIHILDLKIYIKAELYFLNIIKNYVLNTPFYI